MTVSERELKALKALAEFYSPDGLGYISFATIAKKSGLPQEQVRRTVRALARKGLAEYGRGLWSEDGEPMGSGYCCTSKGYELAGVEAYAPMTPSPFRRAKAAGIKVMEIEQ